MDMDMSMSMGTCNSSMLWNWYTIDSCFLAESWHVTSNGAFAASCIGTVLLVIMLEALRRVGKEYDDWVLRGFQARAANARLGFSPPPYPPAPAAARSSASSSSTTNPAPPKGGAAAKVTPASAAWKRLGGGAAAAGGGTSNAVGGGRAVVFRASPLQQVFRAVIHAVTLGLAYIIMLLVMSYNGYIIICVIIGGGLGKFFCDWMTRQYIIDGDGSGDEEDGAAGIEEPSVCCG
ncbi:hypothetical protein Daus18300_006659 [Diaporthe australafricana]|uniref:Copper transport protein n=1 Tax=Diaporthe australafricana TaxID=127596 RepID=A0ABR3WTH4_9PEZI